MKVTTWNVNGIRSLKKDIHSILNDLDSDIVCFQETKISRLMKINAFINPEEYSSQLQENTALTDGYTSYFSYPRNQSGYSGVATYCKEPFNPDDASEILTVNHAFNVDEGSLDVCGGLNDLSQMDFEGRVMITYHFIKCSDEIRRLAVINVYCPRVDPEKPERHFYKMQFCHLLQAKLYELCKNNCSVIIVGDLNIACSVIDHCDPGPEEEFNSSEARQWLKSFLSFEVNINGKTFKAVDAFRHIYPDKKDAYTCWNTKTGARLTNFGTRIDYIILSSDLVSVLSECEILAGYHGSDHCPVSVELKCDAVPETNHPLPSICTRLWPEFSGHQQKLQVFFQKMQTISDDVTNHKERSMQQLLSKNKATSRKNKQKSITSFFRSNNLVVESTSLNQNNVSNCNTEVMNDKLCKKFEFSNQNNLTQIQGVISNSNITSLKNEEVKPSIVSNKSQEWKSLLCGPPKPPLCDKHKKQCVLRSVKKLGPNLGRQFFMCSQPAGPSSNPDSNCNYFKWVTPAKVNTLK